MKTIELQIPEGKKTEWINGVLTLVDDTPKSVTERIKTFEDAERELNERAENGDKLAINLIEDWDNVTTDSDDLIAYLKLRIICAALNEGWQPQFTEDEYHHYPWYYRYTKEEYGNLSDEEKENAFTFGSIGYAGAFSAFSNLSACFGVRLAFKSRKLAEYAGKQFIDIYADFSLVMTTTDNRIITNNIDIDYIENE